MYKLFIAQFGHPTELLGRLAGTIMAYENRERNAWAVSLLKLQAGAHVLEIGFGPGWAIQHITRTTAAEFIVGVDESTVMVQQARKRNAAAMRAGQVDLRQGSVTALPYRGKVSEADTRGNLRSCIDTQRRAKHDTEETSSTTTIIRLDVMTLDAAVLPSHVALGRFLHCGVCVL